MAIADIGAGTDLFTRLFTPAVGQQGTVYAVDIARNFIDKTLRQFNESGMKNVICIVNSQ
jgi:ubiquinone/menaquinone biosynthesis C-methylase UbiE